MILYSYYLLLKRKSNRVNTKENYAFSNKMYKKFAYIHKNNAVSTNRFDYPYANSDEFGDIDSNGVNQSSNSVPLSNVLKSQISTSDNGKGYRTSETVSPRLYFSDDVKRQALYPKSIFNNFCAVNYSLLYGNAPELGNDAENLARHQARYSDYAANVNSVNDDAKAYRIAKLKPSIQNIMEYYNRDDDYGLRSYDYTDFAFLKRLNQIPLNYMLTLRRYPTPCGDGMIDLSCSPKDTVRALGVWDTYGCIAKAVTFMTKENGNDINNILRFAYGSRWEEEQADIQEMESNTTLRSQTINRPGSVKNLIYAARRINESMPTNNASFDWYDNMCGPLRQNFSDRRVYQGDALVDKYGKGILGPINCIDSVYVRSRGLTFEHSLTLSFEYTLKSIAMMNPKAVALDLLANFFTLTGNYGSFWGGATRWHTRPEELGAPVGDIEKLRKGDILGFTSEVANSFVSTVQNIFSGSATEIVEKVATIVAGGMADHLNDIMERYSPLGAAQITKALLRNTPTGNWHLVIGNPLDPIATIGNLCVESTSVSWGPILQGDDFPSSVTFEVTLRHGMPRDIGSIQTMFNMGKGRIYVDIDPKVIEAQQSSNAGTANGYSQNYHSVFGQ